MVTDPLYEIEGIFFTLNLIIILESNDSQTKNNHYCAKNPPPLKS